MERIGTIHSLLVDLASQWACRLWEGRAGQARCHRRHLVIGAIHSIMENSLPGAIYTGHGEYLDRQ
jgi:hypothetical protein